jgi:glucan phosphoethanolaminetransferase (alkaline phosphatase superfamily)
MKISKILSYIVLAIGAIGAILLFLMSNNFDGLMEKYGITETKDFVREGGSMDVLKEATSLVNPLYTLTVIVIIGVIAVTLIAVFSSLAKNPGGLKNTAIGIVAFLIVGIGFVVAEGVEAPLNDGGVLSESGSKWVGTGLYTFYFLAAIAVGLMFFSGIKKLIK